MMQKLKPRIKPLPDGMPLSHPAALVSTWFGAGMLRPMPGTLGTLAAIPPGYLIAHFFGPLSLLAAAFILFIVGTKAASLYGARSGDKDDQSIVVDEVIGLWIAAIPAEGNLWLWALAFALFRFFDIYKLWPASYFDRRKKYAADVLLDDVIAGIYAFCGVAAVAFQLMLGK